MKKNKDLKEGKYSLLTDEWIVEPYTIDLDFNPDEFYEERKKVIEEFVKEFDIKVGDIKRLVQDVEYLKETIENVPDVVKRKWKKWLKFKIESLENEINDFYEKIDEVIKARHELKERYGPDVDENLLFKYLQRYQYIWLAKELKKLMGKGFESEEEVMKMKDILSEFPFRKKGQFEVGEFEDIPEGGMEVGRDEEMEELRRIVEPESPPSGELMFGREPLVKRPEQELAEIVEVPRLWRKLEPLDRQIFYSLEKARVDAIGKGDLRELRRIHDEEERLIEKYKKEVIKSDELSGFSFATRLLEAHYKIQRDKNPVALKIFDKISDEFYKMGFIVENASVVDVDSDEWEEVKKGEAEFILVVSSPLGVFSKRGLIVRGLLRDDGEVVVHPYFWDFLGNKYSLDTITLNSFLGVKKEKLSDEWLEVLTPDEQKDEIEILKSDKLYVLSAVKDKFNELYKEVEYDGMRLLLEDVSYDEELDKIKVVYSVYKGSSFLRKASFWVSFVPKRIVYGDVVLVLDDLRVSENKVIVCYDEEKIK